MRALNLRPHQILIFQLRNHLQGYSPLMTIHAVEVSFWCYRSIKYYTGNSSSTDDSILRLMGSETSMNQ